MSHGASVEASVALGCGAAGLDLVDRAETPAALYGAELAGDAIAIGRWQRLDDTLTEPPRAVRRWTGGPAAAAGDGVLYLALALADASVFMATPKDRVLNRSVRGVLGGLRSLGFAAHYFGRDFVSVDKRPAARIAWGRRPDGRVLLELFLAAEAAFDPDPAVDVQQRLEPYRGQPPTTLGERGQSPTAAALVEACAAAWNESRGLTLAPSAPPAPAALPGLAEADLRWSSQRTVPIGSLRAGLRLGSSGLAEAAELRGDFYQDEDAPARLLAALIGGAPDASRFRDALNATYGAEGATIEGLRSLQPALDAFLELASAAHGGPP